MTAMFDLHCHLLPGIDDGPEHLATSLQMARIAVADGITTLACTPHIYPGLYDNDSTGITRRVTAMRKILAAESIPLHLVVGADVHLTPELLTGIRAGQIPTLAGSRYLLLEPPHHVAPPRFEDSLFQLMASGLIPVITHPERLSWVEGHYPDFIRLAERGVWMQITAGALTGRFGQRPKYWAERFIGEGHAMLLATDAHDSKHRPPLLAEAHEAAAALVGAQEARHLVSTRPAGIVADCPPDQLPPALATTLAPPSSASGKSGFRPWLRRLRNP